MNLAFHKDQELFQASVRYTSEQTGFVARLIEKDYMCSVVLEYLSRSSEGSLIFKGGTCLAKVYWDFNRLSEDLDFIIPMPIESKRKERSRQVTPYKEALVNLPKELSIFELKDSLRGKNECRQYLAALSYRSLVNGEEEFIKLEIGLREPLLSNAIQAKTNTLLQNAANLNDRITTFPFQCLSFEEALAEKFRAALSRKDVAIRDFYDLEYAVLKKGFNFNAVGFIEMVKKKLAVPGNDPPDMSDERISALYDQMNARLKPVLREKDFQAFDLKKAVNYVSKMNSLVG